uniref:Uncharacterized protein n=1 Tax=Anguilla anguilla TaxID=7936 RepID=A0A0E9Q1N8_ANGAN
MQIDLSPPVPGKSVLICYSTHAITFALDTTTKCIKLGQYWKVSTQYIKKLQTYTQLTARIILASQVLKCAGIPSVFQNFI